MNAPFKEAGVLLQGLWVLSGVSRCYGHVFTVSCEAQPREVVCEQELENHSVCLLSLPYQTLHRNDAHE